MDELGKQICGYIPGAGIRGIVGILPAKLGLMQKYEIHPSPLYGDK
jgi:hypothetical protein